MSARVDVEDVQTTKGEKLLAVVLDVFLLIGGIWALPEDRRRTSARRPQHRITPIVEPRPSRQLVARLPGGADRRLRRAERAAAARRGTTSPFRREAYRTALDEGRQGARPSAQAYQRAQT